MEECKSETDGEDGRGKERRSVRKTEEEEGRGRAAVSGIESRGGRCLFINASWLLKGAFD